jgi:hypothetical protein
MEDYVVKDLNYLLDYQEDVVGMYAAAQGKRGLV